MTTYDIRNISGQDVTLVIRSRTGAVREIQFKNNDVIRGVSVAGRSLLLDYIHAGLFKDILRLDRNEKHDWIKEGF